MRSPLILLFSGLVSLSSPARAVESYFLYIPPIVGSASPPGFPGAIPISSFSVGVISTAPLKEDLHVDKPIDSTSPALFKADANGTHFPISDVLIYAANATQPYLKFEMIDAFVSSITVDANMEREAITLNFASGAYVLGVPEPSTSALLLLGLLATAGVVAKRGTSAGVSERRSR